MMVAAISGPASTTNPQTPKITTSRTRRPPLLPSEKDNNNGISNNQRKPKSIVVSSRYMSPSTSTSNSSRRFPSPLVSRNPSTVSNTPSLGLKRSVSADRRRPLTPDLDSKNGNNNNNNKDVSAAAKLLITSTRSLSVSFQGEAFSLPVSKKKIALPSPNVSSIRKGTPDRRRTTTPLRDHADNSKPSDQHRWPARNRTVNPLARSLDCTGKGSKVMGSRNSILALQKSMIDERRVRPSFDGRLSVDLGPNRNSVNIEASPPLDRTASDSDSVSSGSTSGVHDCGGPSHGLIGPRGIADSAKFWQETNSRLRRLQDPSSPLSPGSKIVPKMKRYTTDGPLSSPRTMSSPIRGGGIRPASPSKIMTPGGASPSWGNSPSRVRNGVSTISNSFNGTPTVLGFGVDVWRGKVGENRIVDAHFLRLLYNRHVQWRFVNARTEAVLLVQKHKAEKNLWNVWITISDLRDTVTKKRHRLQLLKQKLKLASILKGQMTFLEDWAFLDKDHSISLLGAIEALKASTLRIPVVGGAIADVQSLKDAIGSAVDVMRALASSICLLLPTVEEMNILASELSKVIAKERALLEQCTDFISLLAAMQVKDSSLRTHILQQPNRV